MPLASLPLLHSNPGATAKLVLDFDGRFQAQWGGWSNVTTPPYDRDGDPTTFSSSELAAIQEIWARVAEDFAPFNIDVTTEDPGHLTDRVVAVIAIGGSASDWYGSGAGGVAYVGGFSNGAPNVGYVFENNLGNGDPKYTAEAASHEAGHLFGLSHQALWSGGTLVQSYYQGNGSWAPIMGVGYYAPRTTWFNGTTNGGPNVYQDDLAILAGSSNGFGYKTDDFGSTLGTASALPVSAGSVNFAGLIGRYDDQDVWSFTTTGGNVTFQLNVAQYGSNLDAVLELWNSSGGVIVTDNPSASQGASITTTIGAGTYYLVARSAGDYGNMGQYTITGTLPSGTATAPEIAVSVSGSNVTDGGTINFGSTSVGSAVSRTFTVANQGTGTLTLTNLNAATMPAGFTLVSNLGATSLAAGQSTTFTVQLNATAAGTFGGTIQLLNNDSDENPFDLVLSGTVTAPEITITLGGANVSDGQTIDFGSVSVGSSVTRTFTVVNDGTSTLTLTALNAATMPAGFTLVSNLGATSLAAGQSTSFSIRLDATAAGTFGGTIQLLNNDSDENSFDLVLTGSVAAPEIAITVGGVNVTDGGTVSFGSTNVGQSVTRVFTVTNQGSSNLTLTNLNAAAMPAGFTLVSNLGATTLAAGQSTSFSIRFDATAAGTFGGTIQLLNNDSDENPFDLVLTGSVAAPEIAITVGGVNVTDGGTVSFGSTNVGQSVSRVFTVTNQGSSNLTLSPLGTNLPAGFTLLSNLGATTLAPGQSTSFTIRFDASAAGSFGGWVSLTSNDADESPFDIQLQGSAAEQTAPEISVLVDGVALASGGTVNFGTTLIGTTIDRTFIVRNDGDATLTLNSLAGATLPAGYSLVQDLSSASLAPGQTATFIVRLDASAGGNFVGTLSLENSDADENPFTIQITGAVGIPVTPVLRIVDNGDAGNGLFGAWTRIAGRGYGGDIHSARKGNGSIASTWSFGSLPAGTYEIYATWTTATNNATNAPYTLYDGSRTIGTIRVNQKAAPNSLAADGANWKLLATVSVTSGGLTVKLTNAANNQVVADAVRIQRVDTMTIPAPEIAAWAGTTPLTSGSSAVSFGTPTLGSPQSITFTVANQGTASLTLSPLDPAALPAGFSLVQNLGSTLLAPGESTTFILRLEATSAGNFGGWISLANNDGDEAPFRFQVTGTVVDPAAPLTQIIDDATAGNTLSSGWSQVRTHGYGTDFWTAAKGTGSASSTWRFTGLPPGSYRVQATWTTASVNATDAPYTLYSGTQVIGTVRVNQRNLPGTFWEGTTAWQHLGIVNVYGGELSVRLTNAANGRVIADAIRIERIVTSGAAELASSIAHAGPPATVPVSGSAQWLVASHLSASAAAQAAASSAAAASLPSPAGDPFAPEELLLADVLNLLADVRGGRQDAAAVDALAGSDTLLDSLLVPLV